MINPRIKKGINSKIASQKETSLRIESVSSDNDDDVDDEVEKEEEQQQG